MARSLHPLLAVAAFSVAVRSRERRGLAYYVCILAASAGRAIQSRAAPSHTLPTHRVGAMIPDKQIIAQCSVRECSFIATGKTDCVLDSRRQTDLFLFSPFLQHKPTTTYSTRL